MINPLPKNKVFTAIEIGSSLLFAVLVLGMIFNPTLNSVGSITGFEAVDTKPCYTVMSIYDLKGQVVDHIASDKPALAGKNTIVWDPSTIRLDSLASGQYFYTVSAKNKITKKGVIIK